MPLFSKRIAGWCAVASLVVAVPGAAQSEFAIEPVRDGLFVIRGDGGNVAVRVTTDGVILVDAGLRGRFADVERLVGSVTEEPIRQVVITHMHPDHTGGLADVDDDVEVIAHSATRDLMQRAGFPGEPRTVFGDELTLDVGDGEVRILHLGAGHTEGDALVYFPDARVVHVGDLLHELAPFIDYAQGGSSAGWVAALDRLLELDFDVVIAGHGELMDRADVTAFRDQLEAVRARMRVMIDGGALRRDVGPGLTTTNLPWTQYRGSPLFRSLAGLYDEVLAEMMRSGFRPHPGQFQN